MVDFSNMTNEERIKAFDIILESPQLLHWGFDWVNDEMFREWFSEVAYTKRQNIYNELEFKGNINDFMEYFTENIDDRIIMWRLMFKNFSKSKQIEFLKQQEKYDQYYSKTLAILNNKYDWSIFKCNLIEERNTSQLYAITHLWNELGMQVYNCRLDNNSLCPCLRASNTGAVYKCFKSYLEQKGLSPESEVPLNMRTE